MNKKLLKLSLIQALGVVAYITLIANIMQNGNKIFGPKDTYLTPVMVLLLFVISASITAGLTFGRSVLWYLDGQKKEAVSLFFYVIGWLFVFMVLVFGANIFVGKKVNSDSSGITAVVSAELSESQARTIAENTCIKGGESLTPGYYNENSRTWWFDANLNATREGCNPACVVSEESKTAEINWRCTGLIVPKK
jgi:hypothetical protein